MAQCIAEPLSRKQIRQTAELIRRIRKISCFLILLNF